MQQKALNAMRKTAGRMRRSAAPLKFCNFILRKKRAFYLTADLDSKMSRYKNNKKERRFTKK
jgi:hypothetical protein